VSFPLSHRFTAENYGLQDVPSALEQDGIRYVPDQGWTQDSPISPTGNAAEVVGLPCQCAKYCRAEAKHLSSEVQDVSV
jgi:hypothetical protein